MDLARIESRRAELTGELERARAAALRIEGAIAVLDELLNTNEEEAPCPDTP